MFGGVASVASGLAVDVATSRSSSKLALTKVFDMTYSACRVATRTARHCVSSPTDSVEVEPIDWDLDVGYIDGRRPL